MGRVELALLLGGVDRKLFQEIFVDSTDQIFFLAKLLVADLVYLVHDLFDVVGGKVAGGKGALDKTALQLLGTGSDAVQCGVQCHIQVCRRRVDDGVPSCFRGKIVGSIWEGGVIKKCCMNVFIVWVKPLCPKFLFQLFNAVLVFLTNKAQEHKGQHHVALFKKRAGVAGSAQVVPAVKQNLIQIQSLFFSFLFCHYKVPPESSVIVTILSQTIPNINSTLQNGAKDSVYTLSYRII